MLTAHGTLLGVASWQTAYKRLALGRMLTAVAAADQLARVGLAKATVVAPAIERLGEWRTWLQCAHEISSSSRHGSLKPFTPCRAAVNPAHRVSASAGRY